jgi:hypothetical protein
MTNSPTINPTSNPTVYPANEPLYPIVITIYVVIALMLITCGTTIHRARTHKIVYDLKMKKLEQEYEAEVATPEGVNNERRKFYETEIAKLMTSDIYKNLGDQFLSPITDSSLSKTVEKIIFHTSIGRILVNIEQKLDASLTRILEYLVSLTAAETFKFYVSKSSTPAQTITNNFLYIFLVYFFYMVISIMKEEFLRSKMGGDFNIVEKDASDKDLEKLNTKD